ncbi:hypothetical protein ACQP2X_11150 [Actinoplanes sp. CA-131856]
MSAGWILAVTVTAAAGGVVRYALHLWGERARYRHEQILERQRQTYGLRVLRQPAATDVKIVALLAGMSPSGGAADPGGAIELPAAAFGGAADLGGPVELPATLSGAAESGGAIELPAILSGAAGSAGAVEVAAGSAGAVEVAAGEDQ